VALPFEVSTSLYYRELQKVNHKNAVAKKILSYVVGSLVIRSRCYHLSDEYASEGILHVGE